MKHLDLKPTDHVYLVSDVSRLMLATIRKEGEFKPQAFISSFKDHLSAGNLLIPGFVNTLKPGTKVDMRTLKPETGGLSKQAFTLFKKNECTRTNDPFHSFFIFGEESNRITEATYSNTDTFGPHSVFDYLYKIGGTLLIIDLELYYGFTFAHYVEQQLNVGYRETKLYPFEFTDLKGLTEKKEFKIYAKKNGYIPVLNSLEKPLQDAGALVKMELNGVPIFKIDLKKAYRVIENDIKNNKARNLINFNFTLYLKQTVKQFTR